MNAILYIHGKGGSATESEFMSRVILSRFMRLIEQI